MQQDRTRIAIRERKYLDILDLSLQVIRTFFWPLATAWLIAVVPLMLLNWWLIGWMVTDANTYFDFGSMARYSFHYTLLVFAESPLLSIPIAGFLGPAVFMERPSMWQIMKNALRYAPHLIFCLLILRGILPIMIFCGTRQPDLTEGWGILEGFLVTGGFIYTAIFHILRPFTTEIILLERTPFFSRNDKTISLFRRSNFLHGPAAHNLIGHWIIAASIGFLLCLSLLISAYVLVGVLINEWGTTFTWSPIPFPGTLQLWWVMPFPLFVVAGFFAVARFLSYLDVRIRNEGWEVELLLVAESRRMQHRIGT